MNFTDILRTAIHALRGNWMRSALTSLGVIIGIAAVIVMVSVGQGTQAEIDKIRQIRVKIDDQMRQLEGAVAAK